MGNNKMQKMSNNKKFQRIREASSVVCRCHACSLEVKARCRRLDAGYTLEATLLLLLLFTLPHAVYGIVTQPAAAPSASQQNGLTTPTNVRALPEPTLDDHSEPHFVANRTGIVELFEWKFSDVGKECETFLGPMGYAGVQLSPVTEHLLIESGKHSWLTFYQPISYKLATRLGSIEDFLEMSRVCNEAGVRVYVDVVLNHVVGGKNANNAAQVKGVGGSVADVSTLDFDALNFSADDFHKPCPIENYLDAHEVRNCQLNGQPDLDHSKSVVREKIIALLNALLDMGVAGFRIDAAKYMWPIDLKSIYAAVNSLNNEEFDFPEDARPFFYQEVVDVGIDSVSKTEYAGYGIVTEYLYPAELATIFSGKVPLSTLINWGPTMGFVSHQDALVFVDTHESQLGYLKRELGQNQLLNYRQRRQHVMATVFMLAHPYGRIKRIMSSYYNNEENAENGPPMRTITTTENEDDDNEDGEGEEVEIEVIRSPVFDTTSQQCTPESGWVCEHRWPPIVNMLKLANDLSPTEDGVINFQTFGSNHIAFCRGQKAFIAFNNDVTLDYETTVHTCLEPGIYCDVISGGLKSDGSDCLGKRIVVKELGMANLTISAFDETGNGSGNGGNNNQTEDQTSVDFDYGVIAIYIGSKLPNAIADDAQVDLIDEGEVKDLNTTMSETSNEDYEEEVFAENVKLDKR